MTRKLPLQSLWAALVLMIVSVAPARAQDLQDLAGRWAWVVEDAAVFVVQVNTDPRTGGWTAGPSSLSLTSVGGAVRVSDIQMPVKRKPLSFLSVTPNGARFRDEAGANEYELRRAPDGSVGLVLTGGALPPLSLTRVDERLDVATTWDADRVYVAAAAPDVDNAELKALYDADQSARQGDDINWMALSHEDAERRVIVRGMLDRDEIRSGADYQRAAFIFQHGDKPEDFLLAHALASAAVAMGNVEAAWISAATLDRYLQNIGKPQIYGTQYQSSNGQPYHQGDYDRTLLPDAVRSVMGVPAREAQEEQARIMNAARDASTSTP